MKKRNPAIADRLLQQRQDLNRNRSPYQYRERITLLKLFQRLGESNNHHTQYITAVDICAYVAEIRDVSGVVITLSCDRKITIAIDGIEWSGEGVDLLLTCKVKVRNLTLIRKDSHIGYYRSVNICSSIYTNHIYTTNRRTMRRSWDILHNYLPRS